MTEYKNGTKLYKYQVGTVVSEVPVRYFDEDRDAMAYRKRHKSTRFWRENVANIMANFDYEKLTPLYYCASCKRLEDGAHRLYIADKLGINKLDVLVGGICYKHYKKLENRSILETCFEVMDEYPTSHRLDRKWLLASALDKWRYLGDVVFKGKSFIDIGCHVGYSCFEAWRRGASPVLGVDTREDVLMVADEVGARIGADSTVRLGRVQWGPGEERGRYFDIVMCMGLIHYFSGGAYKRVLDGLCGMCKDTLILELRIVPHGRVAIHRASGGQTMPTTSWLKGVLGVAGFNHKRFVRDKQREMWIATRKGK
jgi:2-polyprenyl-3-methyl-5-hydroxy-6-metoxy-1,4-benzoquinol methylase